MNSDRMLVEKVLGGETQAFEELITSYYPGLYGFLIKMGIPASRSGDLAQSIFLNAFRNLYRYDDLQPFPVWFFRMAARHVIKDKRRHPQARVSHPDIPEFLLHRSEVKPEKEESLNDLLDPIDDEVRAMFILHYYNKFSLRELGRMFGLSVSSVSMRMERAKEFLAGNSSGTESGQPGAVRQITGRIKQEVSCETVPVESIMSLVENEADRKPGFWERAASPGSLRKTWPIAVSSVLGILLVILLCIEVVSKPFWGSVMTIFDKKEEQPASLDLPRESTSPPISFTAASDLLSGDDLVARLNEMGTENTAWQVLFAGENQVIIGNGHIIACYRNGEFHQLVDLDTFGLAYARDSAEAAFSFSPTGAFMVAGNSTTDAGAASGTVYLFNTADGSYFKLSESGMDQMVHAWSPGGNYLAYTNGNSVGTVFLLNTQTLQLDEMQADVPAARLYVSNSGGISIFSGDMVMTASLGDSAWKSEMIQHEPFYINPDAGTVWYVANGVIMKHVAGSDQDTAIEPDSRVEGDDLQDAYITDYRLVSNHLVFRMRNGNTGTLNMRTGKISVFSTNREMKPQQLPWCLTTPSGARVMFDNEGTFLIVSESSVTTPHIPGYSTLSPRHTRWASEEAIAYVRMVNETEPQAGELSIYTINTLTGAVTEIFRSVDKEPVLNADAPGSSTSIPPVQSAPTQEVRIYETDKATGNRVESFVTQACKVKSGPGDSYADIGEIKQNEIIIYNNRVVNGWCLAQKVSGMLDYYDSRNAFWIRAENIHFYDRYSLPAGVITADKVKLSKASINKGNLIRIIVQGEQKSYVIPDTIDTKFGITGWISNDSFTRDLNGVYFNQAYLKSGSVVYSKPDTGSEPVSDFTAHMADTGTDAFVNLTGEAENGFLYVRHPAGMAGWARKQDIFLPGSTGTSATVESKNLDINGDGIEDKIRFTTDGSSYTLTVNQSRADGHGEKVQAEYKLVDINLTDTYYEIVIEEHGPSDDYMSTFYYYDGSRLINMGKAQGLCGNTDAVKGDGIVRSQTRGSILETWFFTREYHLNSQHKLVETPSAFYEKIGYRNAGFLKLKIDFLPFVVSPGSDEISFVLNRNENVRFVGSDNQRWCLFQTADGRNGWLEVNGFRDVANTGLSPTDVFDGLTLAD